MRIESTIAEALERSELHAVNRYHSTLAGALRMEHGYMFDIARVTVLIVTAHMSGYRTIPFRCKCLFAWLEANVRHSTGKRRLTGV